MSKLVQNDLNPFNIIREEKLPDAGACVHIINQNLPWEEILHLGQRQIITKKSIIPAQHTSIFYYIRTGSIRLERIGFSGGEMYILLIKQGCIFNEMISIINPVEPRSHSDVCYRVMEKSEIYTFQASMLSDPQFILAYPHLMHNILRSTAYKAFLFMNNSSNLHIVNPTARVCRFIYNAHQKISKQQVALPMLTQLELAKFLGLSRSNLGRVILSLRRQGILGAFTKTKLEILDCNRLLELSQMG